MAWENNNEIIIPNGWITFDDAEVIKTQDNRRPYPYNKTNYEVRNNYQSSSVGFSVQFVNNGNINTTFQYLKISDDSMSTSNISPFILPFATRITGVSYSNSNTNVNLEYNIDINGVPVYTNTLSTGLFSSTSFVLPSPVSVPSNSRVSIAVRRIGANHNDPIFTIFMQ